MMYMSSRRALTKLTPRPTDDQFLSLVDRLEVERDPVGRAASAIRTGSRRFIARRISQKGNDVSLRTDAEDEDGPRFEALIETFRSKLDLPRPASVAQALRNADLRTAFLAEVGALRSGEVAQLAGSKARNSSALAGRWRSERRIFAVPWGGELLYPAFQFSDGEPRPLIARVLRSFGGRPSDWEVALWFVTPSAHLPRNTRPLEQLGDPDALAAAAHAERTLPEF